MPNIPETHTAKFAQRSVLLITGNLVKLSVQLAIIYFYSRELFIEDYGEYQSAWLFINIISVVGLFGLPTLLLSAQTNHLFSWIKKNIKTVTSFVSLFVLLPLVYIAIFATNFDITTRLLLIGFILFQNIAVITETLAIKNQKEQKVLIVTILYNCCFIALHFWLLYQPVFSLTYLLIGLMALVILKAMLFLPDLKMSHTNITSEDLGKQWLFLGLFDVVSIITKWLDKWIILSFLSLVQFAIYYNGSYEIPVFPMLLSAVGNIVLVELSKTTKGNAAAAVQMLHRSVNFLSVLVIPAFCFLLFFHKDFFIFLFGEKYLASLPVFFVSIFIIPARICYYTAALQVYNKTAVILKGAILDLLLAIVLMAALYPTFGLPGLAAAFVIATYLQAAYYLWHTGKLLQKPSASLLPFKKIFFLLIACSALSGLAFMATQQLEAFYRLAVGLLLCCITALILFVSGYKKKLF